MKIEFYFLSICILIFVDYVYSNTNESSSTSDLNEQLSLGKAYIEGDQLVEATRGKPISMRCMVHNIKSYKIAWYFNGIFLTLDNNVVREDKRISIKNSQLNEWKLTIDPVDSADEGYYSCRLTNGMKKLIYLKVGVPPRFIGTNDSHQVIINTIEKQNVTLSCEAEGNPVPTIYWYRNNKPVGTGPHLYLKNVTRHSHSEYECVARNKIEPDPSRHFKINVNFKASANLMYHLNEHKKNTPNLAMSSSSSSSSSSNNPITIDLSKSNEPISNDKLNDGELQLVCEIIGNPIYSINWFKDGIKIKDENSKHLVLLNSIRTNYNNKNNNNNNNQFNSKFNTNMGSSSESKRKKFITIHTTQVNQHKYVSKLRIKNIDSMENGIYECNVNGFEGNVSKTVTVTEISSKRSTNENEVEYSIQTLDRNLVKLKSNSNDQMSSSLSSSRSLEKPDKYNKELTFNDDRLNKISNTNNNNNNNNNQIAESNYLMLGRGARSNLTKLENNYNFNEMNNSATKQLNNQQLANHLKILSLIFILKNYLIYFN